MESYVKNASHPGDVSHSHAATSQDAGNGSSDNSHANRGLELRETELKTAVSVATAQFGQDLHAVGSELLNIESRHRALMERLQQIAEQVDEHALRQFETLQEEVTGARRQNLSLREDLEVFRASFPEQLELIGSQCAKLNQQFQTAEQRLEELEHQLRNFVHRIQTAEGQHDAVQQRLRPAEQKLLEAEQNLQRADAQFQVTEQRFKEIEQKIYIVDQRIQTAENKHSAMEQMLHAAEQRIQATETKHNAMEQMLQAAEKNLLETEQKLADTDRENKTFATQMKTRAERLTAEWDEIKRIFNEQATRRENIEISIGELGQDIGQLKGQFSELLTGPYESLKIIQVTMKSYRRILLISVVAFILTLLTVGYLQLGKPGWPIFSSYLSQWLPGLPI